MTKKTHVYSIGYYDWPTRHASFFRYDPRREYSDTCRSYRRFSEASALRFARLLGDGTEVDAEALKNPDRMRIGRRTGVGPNELREVNR